MDAEQLRELQDRGRFFYERFPGAAAAEAWKQTREKAEREHAARSGKTDAAGREQADTASERADRPRPAPRGA